MKKTIAVYDKWLHTLGGGEVVTCYIAKILRDEGYDVTLLCGKKIPTFVIKEKLGVDLTGIDIIESWNDEPKLKKLTENKDFFINTTFMDFTVGFARKNIYYTYFPIKINSGFVPSKLKDFLLLFSSKLFKQVEIISKIEASEVKYSTISYLFNDPIKAAISYLETNTKYSLKFSIFLENFSKSLLNIIEWELENAEILGKEIKIDQDNNLVEYNIHFISLSSTIYLKVRRDKSGRFLEKSRTYLLSPSVVTVKPLYLFYKFFLGKVSNRLSAGYFLNIPERIDTYQIILSVSCYAQKWIKTYWKRDSQVLYPPVDMVFKKDDFRKVKKKNTITSIGRFFTSGHSKKQDIMVKAFKKLHDLGYKKWQLHLIGGLSSDSSSLKFSEHLKEMAKGYPIYFHFNVSRKEVEETLLKSKIYWHATGFGESETKSPEKFEHFGISPIEAISAGCTPVLFNGGGLKEIINELNFSEKNLFSSIDELVNNTKYFIEQNDFENVANRTTLIDKNFSASKFREELLKIFANLGL